MEFVRSQQFEDPCSLQQPQPVSSHDPSATPIIPRAGTRWKKAATEGEQCFGNKTPRRRKPREYGHVSIQLRSCVGECGAKSCFSRSQRSAFTEVLVSDCECVRSRGCTESQHHCFCCMGRNAGFHTGQLAANLLARGCLIVINTTDSKLCFIKDAGQISTEESAGNTFFQ